MSRLAVTCVLSAARRLVLIFVNPLYKGPVNHAFGVACYENGIGQKFTRVARPQTNGKAERVIRTLMEMWHEKQSFDSPEHRRKELCRFVNFYNTVKPHRSLNGDTPFEVLQAYFSQPVV
nr:integrase core domain-containing protein [Eikenella corrodens]